MNDQSLAGPTVSIRKAYNRPYNVDDLASEFVSGEQRMSPVAGFALIDPAVYQSRLSVPMDKVKVPLPGGYTLEFANPFSGQGITAARPVPSFKAIDEKTGMPIVLSCMFGAENGCVQLEASRLAHDAEQIGPPLPTPDQAGVLKRER